MAYTTINKPSDYFNTVLYTGNGSTQSITGVNFQPDLVWLKDRTNVSDHLVQDVIRGATYNLRTNTTNAQDVSTGNVTSFDSDGFSLGTGGYANASGDNFVSWNWLADNTSGSSNTDGSITSTVSASTTSGFSIVSYTGTGANATIGHGLGATPKLIIVKKTSAISAWEVFHSSISNMNTSYIELNSTSGVASLSTVWGGTDPTSTTFHVGTDGSTNGSSSSYIAYCFAEKKGFSKFGSYTGNGSADGTFVYTGFKPAFLLYKCSTDNFTNWQVFDNKRSTYNLAVNRLNPNDSSVELATTADSFDLLSNGFKARGTATNSNNSGSTYIYMAFAEHPLVSSTGVPCTAR